MKNKTIPTQLQTELLMTDWLNGYRDSQGFVHRNIKGTIEHKLKKGEHYSNYFAGTLDTENPVETIRQAREIAQKVINVTVDIPCKVTVGGNGSYSTGNAINVATNYFDDNALTAGEKTDILVGLAIHEASHVTHSDFNLLERYIDSQKRELRKLKKSIANVLEDERVEMLTTDKMNGCSDFIAIVKEYYFGKFKKELKANIKEDTNPVVEFLNTLLKIVRYPSVLTEEEIQKHFDILCTARGILTPFPTTPQDVFDATDRLTEALADYISKKQSEQKSSPQQNKPDSQSESSGTETSNNDGAESNKSVSNNEKLEGYSTLKQNSNVSNKKEDGTNKATAQDKQTILQEALKDTNAKTVVDALYDSVAPDVKPQSYRINSELDIDYANGKIDYDKTTKMLVSTAGYNKVNYITSFKRIKHLIPSMTKALTHKTMDKNTRLQGMKSGHLNTNKLVSLKMGNNMIFSRKSKIRCESACVAILIDESGSMKGDRMKAATDAAILIQEALDKVHKLNVYIYGFQGNNLKVYYEIGNQNKWSLGSTKADGDTPTGKAMLTAAQRIRKQTPDRCLMLVLTDGRPSSVTETQEAETKLLKDGFITIGVGIQTNHANIFKESITIDDLPSLPILLGRLVRKTAYSHIAVTKTVQ